MSNQPNKFCKAPFKTAVIDTDGTLLPCCEFMTYKSKMNPYKLNTPDDWMFKQWWKSGLDPLREKMLNGETDPGCEHCISKEKNPNIQSVRELTNNKIKDTYEEIRDAYKKNDKERELPKYIELRLGNYCNLKCIMCGPYASSSILAEYKKYKDKYNNFGVDSNYEIDHWWEQEHNKKIVTTLILNAKEIYFGGGEPFMSPILLDVLKIIDSDICITFNTNMTRFTDDIINTLKRFKRINILSSIDGVGAHNEYLRNGSKWEVVSSNIKKLKALGNIQLNITYLLQHTSLYTMKDVIQFAKDTDIQLNINEVYSGSVDGSGHLTINSALAKDIDNFKIWFDSCSFTQKDTVRVWLDSFNPNADLHKRFKDYVKMLDSMRGTDFVKTFNPSWT
tara:strand:+ start:3553 stop:4728 length:1176 start_codon:yes stop_codon:yes gene_type:complete